MKLKIFLTNGQCVEVDAEIYGDWAVHRTIFETKISSHWYTVTHCPSSLAVTYYVKTKRQAASLAKILNQETGGIKKWKGRGMNKTKQNYFTDKFLESVRYALFKWNKTWNKDGQGRMT